MERGEGSERNVWSILTQQACRGQANPRVTLGLPPTRGKSEPRERKKKKDTF